MSDVTATCPPPVVQIDRSFAVEPPECLSADYNFQFADDSYAGALVQTIKEAIAPTSQCLADVKGWIESERKARHGESDGQ